MASSIDLDLIFDFPGLAIEGYTRTSCRTDDYNCIAWASHETKKWWWPFGVTPETGKEAYWPKAPKKETVNAFVKAFAQRGYKRFPENNADLQDGYEKIALYALGTRATHAARQLPDGNWTHKLGANIDITASLTAVEGLIYGTVVLFLRRKISN